MGRGKPERTYAPIVKETERPGLTDTSPDQEHQAEEKKLPPPNGCNRQHEQVDENPQPKLTKIILKNFIAAWHFRLSDHPYYMGTRSARPSPFMNCMTAHIRSKALGRPVEHFTRPQSLASVLIPPSSLPVGHGNLRKATVGYGRLQTVPNLTTLPPQL